MTACFEYALFLSLLQEGPMDFNDQSNKSKKGIRNCEKLPDFKLLTQSCNKLLYICNFV